MILNLLLLSIGIQAYAGIVPQTSYDRIINGNDTQAGEIPYQISLQYTFNSFHFCGGSVLSEKYVITAAHCVVSTTAKEIKVVAATTNLQKPKSTHLVTKIIVYEQFNYSGSAENDIALVEIKDRFIVSAVLQFVSLSTPNQDIPAGSVAIISGWGIFREDKFQSTSIVLQKAEVFITSQGYCKQAYKNSKWNIYDTEICAHNPIHQTGPCNGDSGGPLMVDNKLVGLASWGASCSVLYPTVYTRVSSFLDWIEANAV